MNKKGIRMPAIHTFRSLCLGLMALMISVTVMAAGPWTINMKDAEIRSFVEQVAEITGKTFVVDPAVKGRVTVISNENLNEAGVYEVFLTVLQIHGFGVLESDDVIKVVKQADVKSLGGTLDVEQNIEGMNLVTRVIFIKNGSAMELVPLLRPMVAKYGHLAGVNSANAIIITDHAENIERINGLIGALDISSNDEIEVVQLQFAWVGNLVGLLERLVPEEVAAANERNRVTGGRIRVVADERSNSIILKGEEAYRTRIRELIKTLDTPSTQNASSKVIFLNNADSKKMAELLKGFSGAVEKSQQTGDKAPPASPTAILADEDLNALIIRAEPTVLSEIEAVVAKLDIPRAQVLIEAAIVEVTGNVGDQFGVQWATNPQATADEGEPFIGTNFNEAGQSISGLISSVSTNGVPSLGEGLLFGIADPEANFGAIVQALESQSNANLLSTPSIMTLDNSEATLLVGGTVPFRTTSQSTSGGNPFETITREDVGISLRVIPHIMKDGNVRLEVEQKTEAVLPKSDDGTVDIQTAKREITTEVLVAAGETIVLGGLIKDDVSKGVSKVPVLGSIPGLGVLFRAQFERHEKVNLLVFIRPTIIKGKVTDLSHNKLRGIWELRMDGDTLNNGETPSFEELFTGMPSGR
jgi:general secretion pathway protein D